MPAKPGLFNDYHTRTTPVPLPFLLHTHCSVHVQPPAPAAGPLATACQDVSSSCVDFVKLRKPFQDDLRG